VLEYPPLTVDTLLQVILQHPAPMNEAVPLDWLQYPPLNVLKGLVAILQTPPPITF
jgi:hypothetical protein